MRYIASIVLSLALFMFAVPAARPQNQNSIVIVFKDGHQKTFSLSEIARIDFESSATSSSMGQGRFLGEWRVGDGAGGHFKITLERGGVAHKSVGAPNGTWTVVDGEAHMTWDDGWRDAIRKSGDRWEKSAYSPGKTFADDPDHTVGAERKSHEPL